ncbi:hypothetical protein NEOKW01_0137 [Nematocida sp. AWRm80]|nr:hypothetical protein NEOKW01_0137 [Nematocida sp. AWRm80]
MNISIYVILLIALGIAVRGDILAETSTPETVDNYMNNSSANINKSITLSDILSESNLFELTEEETEELAKRISLEHSVELTEVQNKIQQYKNAELYRRLLETGGDIELDEWLNKDI